VALLYPTEDALELTPQTVLDLPEPLVLVVPDGSWGQAKKVATREPSLKGVLRVKIPVGLPSQYRLRFSPHEQNLCTFEAIARALGAIEGVEVQQKLESIFLVMVERILWSRGVLKPEDCTTPIPEAAFLASKIAGMAGGQKRSVSLKPATVDS
jgi:DTW domain-containing protein YfiP